VSIAYPLTLPSVSEPNGITIRARSAVGISVSPFTFGQQLFVHPGDIWEADISLPPMLRPQAETWLGFLLALNGREGTFLMGEALNRTARGTWAAASPFVNGAHAAMAKTVAIDNLAASATGKSGDWLQFGSAGTSRLHKLVQDFTANGSGQATIEIWPRLREGLADNAAVTVASPRGVWRLSENVTGWTIGIAQIYGLQFSAVEAL
jgi:hypothetical protein